jgi:arylamine N-acetyltransferase
MNITANILQLTNTKNKTIPFEAADILAKARKRLDTVELARRIPHTS